MIDIVDKAHKCLWNVLAPLAVVVWTCGNILNHQNTAIAQERGKNSLALVHPNLLLESQPLPRSFNKWFHLLLAR